MAKLNFTAKQIAKAMLPRLIDSLTFPNLIHRDAALGEVAECGDVVSVSCPARLIADESAIPAENSARCAVDVVLDRIASVDFPVDAVESAEDFSSVIRRFIEPAAAALAEKINADGLTLYRDIPYVAGEAGITPDGFDAIAKASYKFDVNKVPFYNRSAVWDVLATSKLKQVSAIANAEMCGTNSALRANAIGRVLGIDNYMSGNVAEHIPTYSGMLTLAADATDAEEVTLTATVDGTLKHGDLLKVSGQTYTVLADAEVSGSSVTVKVCPKMTSTANKSVALLPQHSANLIFQTNAFVFVSRPLPKIEGMEYFADCSEGVSLRVVRGGNSLSVDVLYGYHTISPECAIRYLG